MMNRSFHTTTTQPEDFDRVFGGRQFCSGLWKKPLRGCSRTASGDRFSVAEPRRSGFGRRMVGLLDGVKVVDAAGRNIILRTADNILAEVAGGGKGPGIQPSLVDAALICKEFLNLRHVIECGLLSGEALRRFLVCPTRIMSIICPCSSCLPHNSAVRFGPCCRFRQRIRSMDRDSFLRASSSPRCRAPSCWPARRQRPSAACVRACVPAKDLRACPFAGPSVSRPSRR
jgi:hypothetical protein